MLNDADKQKLKECWQRVAQGPAAAHVLAAGKGKDGADITVGSTHEQRLNHRFDEACADIENAIDCGVYEDVDDYIGLSEFFHSDVANITRPMEDVVKEWEAKKLQP